MERICELVLKNPCSVQRQFRLPAECKEEKDKMAGVGENAELNVKLKHILSCDVCYQLRRSPIFQCKYGHLLCAGCIGDIFAESKMQNEIPTCPNCQSTLSKDTCFRNIAVERSISELPMTCPFCFLVVAPQDVLHHERHLCPERLSTCCNKSIGCRWEGPHSKKSSHEEECKQISANGLDILQSLLAMDDEAKKEASVYDQIYELLSVETFLHFDLQFKQCPMTSDPDDLRKVFFNTPKFMAYDNQWQITAYFKEDTCEFKFQLNLKIVLNRNKTMNLYYLVLKGPYSEIEIKPKLCQFKFDEKCLESPFQPLTLSHNKESSKYYFSARRINFRLFFFLAK